MSPFQRLVKNVADAPIMRQCCTGTCHLKSRFLHILSCNTAYAIRSMNNSPGCAHMHSHEAHDELSNMAKDLNVDKVDLAEKILRHSIKESEGKLGSGIDGTFLCANPCANWSTAEGFACSNTGVIPCASCGLVHYCSLECKEENQDEHESWCGGATKQKGGVVKNPTNTPAKKTILKAESAFVWGNVPAYGILGRNIKADDISENLSLCFCASGDLRNVIETVCQLPEKCGGQVTIYINDHNPLIVARNFLMLKLLQVYGYDALDAVVALWYSAAMTHSQSIVIDGVVIDTLRSTVGGGKDKELHVDFTPLSSSTLSIYDGFKIWPLLARMSACKSSMQEVWSLRSEKLKGALKFDCKAACLRPAHRVAWKEFCERGLLLPFGAYCAHHCAPNKFLFHSSGGWLLHADANPISGWDIMSILATGSAQGLPESDMFGSLFFHVRNKLHNFLHKLRTCEVHFKLSCKDATQMAMDLASQNVRLHCIDTSNLADSNYGGICRVLHDWGPLLDRGSDFTATLITYFMNWAYADTTLSSEQITLSKLTWKDVHSVVELMHIRSPLCSERLKGLLALGNSHGNLSILDYFHNFTGAFEEYLYTVHAEADARRVGLTRRKKHLVVPHRLSLDIDDCNGIPGRTASYDQCYYDCIVGDLTFTEQFVEWGVS